MKMKDCLKKIDDLVSRIESIEKHMANLKELSFSTVQADVVTGYNSYGVPSTVVKLRVDKSYILDQLDKELTERRAALERYRNVVDMAELALRSIENSGG